MTLAYRIYCRAYQGIFRLAANFLDWTPPEVIRGAGSVEKLPSLLRARGIHRVLIVTGGSTLASHRMDRLLAGLNREGIACHIYDKVAPNPTVSQVEGAVMCYREQDCQGFLAFGGGSPMDCAKAAAARIARPEKTIPMLRGQLKIRRKTPPIFAVPTTAGTGSETTLAAVIANPETREKNAINDPVLMPRVAVLDPELTVSLPPKITAATGMDALTHATEAFIGRSNTARTEADAREAVRLIFGNLERAWERGDDLEARENMLLASHYAGRAFTRAYVGYVHAIAHKLGGLYGTAHGLANGVILPYVLEYYGESVWHRLAVLADTAGLTDPGQLPEEKSRIFIGAIRDMNRRMGLPAHLPEIREGDIPVIADCALREANPLYPVPKIMTREECMALLRKLKG